MSRPFGMIVTSIWGSNRFRSLPSDTDRLAYFYVHTNAHGNSIGAYRLPQEYLVADMVDIDRDRAMLSIKALQTVDLIEYDPHERAVRITNWFKHNPINSPKHLAGALTQFDKLPSKAAFLPTVAAEIVISAATKSRSLIQRGRSQMTSDKSDREKSYGKKNLESADAMNAGLTSMLRDLPAAALESTLETLSDTPDDVKKALIDGLGIDLPIPLSIPLSIGLHDTDTKTETQTDTQTQTQTETGKTAVQADIEALNEKSRKPKK